MAIKNKHMNIQVVKSELASATDLVDAQVKAGLERDGAVTKQFVSIR